MIEFEIPGHVASVLNIGERWERRAVRARMQKRDAEVLTRMYVGPSAREEVRVHGARITMTRVFRGPGKALGRMENFMAAGRPCVEGVKKGLGIGEDDSKVIWVYEERKEQEMEPGMWVRVEIL